MNAAMALVVLLVVFMAAIIVWFVVTWMLRNRAKRDYPNGYRERYDYTDDRILSVLGSVFVNHWVYDRKLLITLHYSERSCVLDPKREARREIIRTEYWTDAKKKEIHLDGYKSVKGMHDSLLWLFVPMYLRIDNAKFFTVPDTKTNGKFDYPQDTAETLHDYASSNATQKFIAAMAKTAFDKMDTHTIIMLIILIVGAVFGLHIFGVF